MTIDEIYRIEWNHPKRGWEEITIQNSELEWSEVKEENEVFYRRELNTELVFKDTEYSELIKLERSRSRCNFIDIRFEKKCDGTYYDFWNGRIHLIDGKYDLENCIIRINARVRDDYTCLFDNWEEEKNILEEVGAMEAPVRFGRYKLYVNKLTSRYVPTYDTDVDSFHNTLSASRVQDLFDDNKATEEGWFLDDIDYSNTSVIKTIALSEPIRWDSQGDEERAEIREDQKPQDFPGSWFVSNWYAFELYEDECDGGTPPDAPDGDEWVQLGSPSCPSDTFRWYRPVEGIRCDESSQSDFEFLEIQVLNPSNDNTAPFAYQWRYENECTVPNFINSEFYEPGKSYEPLSVDNGMSLNAVIEYFAGLCGLPVISNFYGINANDQHPNNEYYTYADNNLQALSLFQLTDISNPFAEENATKARVTFKELLDDLKVLHNVYWEIRNGTFYLEHLSYFKNQYKVDLTASVGEYIEGLKSYEYIDPDFPKREEWQFKLKSDKDTTQEFDGIPIVYESACIGSDSATKNLNTKQIVTNFNFFSQNESYQDQDGLFLLATDAEDDYYIESGGVLRVPRVRFGEVRYAKYTPNALTGIKLINSSQAIPNLLENLHTFGRPQESGVLNNEEVKFTSFVRQRLGGELTFPICCDEIINDLDPSDLFKSYLGWGDVESFTFTEPQSVIRLTLKHD